MKIINFKFENENKKMKIKFKLKLESFQESKTPLKHPLCGGAWRLSLDVLTGPGDLITLVFAVFVNSVLSFGKFWMTEWKSDSLSFRTVSTAQSQQTSATMNSFNSEHCICKNCCSSNMKKEDQESSIIHRNITSKKSNFEISIQKNSNYSKFKFKFKFKKIKFEIEYFEIETRL